VARKKWSRFPGLKKSRLKPDDSHFSSGELSKKEKKEWADWDENYKKEDYFKAYLAEVKNIPNCDSECIHKTLERA